MFNDRLTSVTRRFIYLDAPDARPFIHVQRGGDQHLFDLATRLFDAPKSIDRR